MTRTIGVILCAIGVIGLVWGGITYTKEEKVIDIGPVQVTQEKTRKIPFPPVVGAVALVTGLVLIGTGKRS